MITLGNAAKQLGVSKPTLSKAISRGHLSATRREDGSFSIDPAELMRWWESSRHRFHLQPVSHFQPLTLSDESGNSSGNPVDTVNTANTPAPVDNEVRVQLARLEAELAGVRELLKVHKEQIDDLRGERDKLLGQVDAAHRLLTHQPATPPVATERPRRPWWRRLAG
jgi:excisionase family DNA binding protein